MSKHMNTDVQVRKIPNSRLWEIKAAQKQIRDIIKSKTANVKCGKDTHIFYVEAPHRFQGCYRCGQDGLTSYECTAKDDEIRCVKCSGEHPWALCESERELCLFCAQPHMGMRCPLKKGGEPIEKQRVRTVPKQAPASRAAASRLPMQMMQRTQLPRRTRGIATEQHPLHLPPDLNRESPSSSKRSPI
jgi:hypothetical protein